jgi:hypothetical protein
MALHTSWFSTLHAFFLLPASHKFQHEFISPLLVQSTRLLHGYRGVNAPDELRTF